MSARRIIGWGKSEALYYLRQSIREARKIKADFIALDSAGLIGRHTRKELGEEVRSGVAQSDSSSSEG